MSKNNKLKISLIVLAYIISLGIILSCLIPYKVCYIYVSSQNVPHAVIKESGFTSLSGISDYITDYGDIEEAERDYTITKEINIPILLSEMVFITALAGIAIYLCVIQGRKGKNTNDTVENIGKITEQIGFLNTTICSLDSKNSELNQKLDIYKEENNRLNVKIQELQTQNSYLLLKIGQYEDLKPSWREEAADLPKIDISSLAFSDEDTQEKAKNEYAMDMYNYIKNRIDNKM